MLLPQHPEIRLNFILNDVRVNLRIQLFDVPVGVNTVEVDTFDASGGLIIQNQQTVQVQSCGDTSVVLDLSALRGNIDIDFQFPCSTIIFE